MVGRAIMALAVLQTVLSVVATTRRFTLAIALPMGVAVAAISGVAFWIGYTMATTDWDEPADYIPGE